MFSNLFQKSSKSSSKSSKSENKSESSSKSSSQSDSSKSSSNKSESDSKSESSSGSSSKSESESSSESSASSMEKVSVSKFDEVKSNTATKAGRSFKIQCPSGQCVHKMFVKNVKTSSNEDDVSFNVKCGAISGKQVRFVKKVIVDR